MNSRFAGERDRAAVSDRRDERPPSFFVWWRMLEWTLIPVAFVVVRFVPDRPARLAGWLLLMVAAVLFAAPAILASYREHRTGQAQASAQQLAVEYRTRLGLTVGEAMIPIGDLLGRTTVASRGERPGLQGQLRQRVVDAAAALATAGRARAAFFALEGRTLRLAAWAGRPEPPSPVLARTAGGEAAYRLLENHDRLLVPDVSDRDAAGFRLGGEYGAFLAVAVYAGSKNLGVVTVDAPTPEVLAETDLDIATALAQMLGVGLALGSGATTRAA